MNNRMKVVGWIFLFALVWGVLSKFVGLISSFDSIETVGEVSPAVVTGSVKFILYTLAIGLITLLIARFGISLLARRERE